MNSAKLVALCVVAVGFLTLADIVIRVRQQRLNAFTKQFAAVPLYTNGVSGMLIKDRAKDQALWGVWNFKGGDSVNCFVEGKLVLGVNYVPEGRAETVVNFYGKDGKLISQWKARENGVFYGRTFFGEGGNRSEVWLNESWHRVEWRTNGGKAQTGTVLDGNWRRLVLTNAVPGIGD